MQPDLFETRDEIVRDMIKHRRKQVAMSTIAIRGAELAAAEPRKLARRGAPITSKLAALEVPNFAGEHHAVIVQALKDHGARGLTVHEIAAYCRLDAHAIGKRVGELQRGQVLDVAKNPDGSDQARPTPSGRSARVWVLK